MPRTLFNLRPYIFFLITSLAFIGTAKWRNTVLYHGRYWILTQGRQGQTANGNNGFKGLMRPILMYTLRKDKTGTE